MGFYVNVVAKKGCARQINSLWKNQFDGFLIYTPAKIKKEIEFIHNDPESQHLNYIKTVSDWGNVFPIYKNGSGQVFLRPLGFSEERAEEFKQENKLLLEQVQFILDNRLLFEKVSSLQDAVDALGMNISCDYMENGRSKKYTIPTFENLRQINDHPVFIRCLEIDSPILWERFLDILDNGLNNNNWANIRSMIVEFDNIRSLTIWQRCEKIEEARTGINYGLFGKFNSENVPNDYDLIKAITLTTEDFDKMIKRLKLKVA